jgi:Protein of unknown function (DUF3788)
MESSVFTDKDHRPAPQVLEKELGKLYSTWEAINAFTFENFPGVKEEWNYSKSGWNARIKDKKRAIIYLMPCAGFFKVSFVFGDKATRQALAGDIDPAIKSIIGSAPVYGEGRGFRIEVRNRKMVKDIEQLLLIKKAH